MVNLKKKHKSENWSKSPMFTTYSTNQTNKGCGMGAINQSIFLKCLWWECIEKHAKNPFDVNLDFVHNFSGEIFTRYSGWAVQHNLTRCQCNKTALLRHWQDEHNKLERLPQKVLCELVRPYRLNNL